MYTRDYIDSADELNIPKNYSGTALASDETQAEPDSEKCGKMVENKETVPSWFEKIGINSILPRFSGMFSGKLKLGTEEIIIIAILLFLIITKSQDIECIIILASLLFI